jgi:hypothetical protein
VVFLGDGPPIALGEPASDSRLMRSASRLGSVKAGTKPAASLGSLRTNKAGGQRFEFARQVGLKARLIPEK